MDELNDTQSVEVGEQPYTGDLSELVPDDAVDAAPSGEVFEQEVAPEPSSFNALDAELGDLEELQHDGFYEKITEDHIKDLPPTARRILHNFRVDRKLAEEKHVSQMESLQTEIEKRESGLSDMEREFAKRQAEFASLVEDPEVQRLLTEPDGELPDIFTEEGVEARIQRGIAKGMSAILEPMKHAADVKARESNYLDFVGQHPEMKDTSFKKDVAGLVRSRAEDGIPLSTQDAYQIVKARRVMAQQQSRVAQEQRARQQSARRIGRAVSGGNPSSGGLPPEVKKKGAYAISQWLAANPEAARKLSQSFR
jgi:hypothetical protein|tara:strand:+ start:672 stop:1601 length:930 start_codon:yes stop_codon:yes gene_type:complete